HDEPKGSTVSRPARRSRRRGRGSAARARRAVSLGRDAQEVRPMSTEPEISFIGTGDCGPVHGPKDGFPIERYTELVRPTLESVDLRFGNCERQYSRRGTPSETSPHGCQPPEMAQIFTDCRFDAVTIANNHMYDFGPEALLDTRALLLDNGIQVTGAGKNLDEARQPAIV